MNALRAFWQLIVLWWIDVTNSSTDTGLVAMSAHDQAKAEDAWWMHERLDTIEADMALGEYSPLVDY